MLRHKLCKEYNKYLVSENAWLAGREVYLKKEIGCGCGYAVVRLD